MNSRSHETKHKTARRVLRSGLVAGAAIAATLASKPAPSAQAEMFNSGGTPSAYLPNKALNKAARLTITKLAERVLSFTGSTNPYVSYSHYNAANNLGQVSVRVGSLPKSSNLPQSSGSYTLSVMAPENSTGQLDPKRTEMIFVSENPFSGYPDIPQNPYETIIITKNSQNGSYQMEGQYTAPGNTTVNIAASTQPPLATEALLTRGKLLKVATQVNYVIDSAESLSPTSILNPAFIPAPGQNTVPLK